MLPEITLEDTLRIAGVVTGLYKIGSANGSELSTALEDFAAETIDVNWALIGGLAVGFHSRPRGTQDVDILLKSGGDIDKLVHMLKSFKRHRSHAFEHKKTGVEVEVLTPEFLNIDSSIVSKAIETSEKHNLKGSQVPVVSKAGLVALKLQRGKRQDLADIESVLSKDRSIDCSEYNLTEEQKKTLEEIREDLK